MVPVEVQAFRAPNRTGQDLTAARPELKVPDESVQNMWCHVLDRDEKRVG